MKINKPILVFGIPKTRFRLNMFCLNMFIFSVICVDNYSEIHNFEKIKYNVISKWNASLYVSYIHNSVGMFAV